MYQQGKGGNTKSMWGGGSAYSTQVTKTVLIIFISNKMFRLHHTKLLVTSKAV
jgi:hypothetical protein